MYDTMKDYFNNEFKSFPIFLNSHTVNPYTKKIHAEYIQSILFTELMIKYYINILHPNKVVTVALYKDKDTFLNNVILHKYVQCN